MSCVEFLGWWFAFGAVFVVLGGGRGGGVTWFAGAGAVAGRLIDGDGASTRVFTVGVLAGCVCAAICRAVGALAVASAMIGSMGAIVVSVDFGALIGAVTVAVDIDAFPNLG